MPPRLKRTRDGISYGLGGRYLLGERIALRLEYRRSEMQGRYDPEGLLAGALLHF